MPRYKYFILGTLLVLGTLMILSHKASAAGPQCYNESLKTVGGSETIITKTPGAVCDYSSLESAGFVMQGLPNPLAADQCYYWPYDASQPAQVVDCNDPKYANAPDYGGSQASNVALPSDTSQASSEPINTDRAAIRNCDGSTDPAHCLADNPLVRIIQDGLVFLSAVVGIVVIGSIIMGGIQYSASHGDPNAVAKAKTRITNALIAFVAYIFLYAFLQWLIPGGPF